jgi:hypothetical protein
MTGLTGLAGLLAPLAASSTPVVRRCSGRAPPGSGCGVDRWAFNGREPLFNRRSPPLLPQAGAHSSPCRPPPRGDLSATVLALRSPWGGARLDHRDPRGAGALGNDARGGVQVGGIQLGDASAQAVSSLQDPAQDVPPRAARAGDSGSSRLPSPVWLRCRGSAAGSASPAAAPRRPARSHPEQLQPAIQAQRLGLLGRRGPGQRLGALDLDADQHGGRFQGTLSTVDHASVALGPHRRAGDGVQPGCTVVQAGWVKDPAGQRCQAIGARGSGV